MADDFDIQKDISKSISEFICRQHECSDRAEGEDKPLAATHSELIMMALVDMRRPASAKDIDEWITMLLGQNYREHRPPHCHRNLQERLLTITHLLETASDLPVVEIPSEKGVPGRCQFHQHPSADHTLTEPGSGGWATLIRDAAPFLHRRLFSPWSSDKHFPIMELPIELRESIFKYALVLPSGARIKLRERGKNRQGETWAISAPRWHCGPKRYEVDPDFLALLRVSKSFYQEASPCFWSQVVVCGTPSEICRLLQGATAWKSVEQLDLRLREDRDQLMPGGKWVSLDDDGIAALATLPRLCKLSVRWLPLFDPFRRGQLDVANVACIASLRRHVRGLKELEVHRLLSDCEDVLRAELIGPRAGSGMS